MPQIEISIQENDTYGDGWQGQWVRIFDSNGAQVAAHTLEGGNSGTDVFTLESDANYTWTFGEGSWIEESSFTMTRTDTGEVLGSASGVASSGSFSLGEAEEVVPVYHYLNLLEASIDVDGELQDAPGFDIDFDEFGPPNSYTVDSENEQLVLSTSLATGDGAAPNFKAELPDIGPGGSIVLKLAGWTFGASAGLGTDEGEPTRHSDTMASEQIAIVLQEYQPDSLDNAESQQFINIGFLRNELGGSDSWHDLTFDVFSGNYEGAPGWHGVEDAGAGALGVYAGTDWGLDWWPNKMVAAHWNHATANGRTGLTDFLAGLDSPYSGGSIENDSVHEAYNKLIQQFLGYYRFSRVGSNTIRTHYSPDGSTWLLVEESSDFNVQNRMGLHLWCRLSDSVVRFEDIIASENTIITDVSEAIAAAQAPAEEADDSPPPVDGGDGGEADIATGLVGRWSFSNASAEAEFGADGTNNGAAFETVDGRTVASLASGDYIQIDNAGANFTTEDFSAAFWFYNGGSAGDWAGLISTQNDVGGNGYGWAIHRYYGNDTLFTVQSGNGGPNWSNNHPSQFTIPLNTWTHVVLTRVGTEMKVYLNGSDSGYTGSCYATIAHVSDELRIGRHIHMEATSPGKYDDVRVYSRALSANDVASLYDASPDSADIVTGLVGRFSFESDGSDSVGVHSLNLGNGAVVSEGAMALPNTNSGAWPQPPVQLGDSYTISIWFKDLKDRQAAASGWMQFDGTSNGGGSDGSHAGFSADYTITIYTDDLLGAWDTEFRSSGYSMAQGDFTGWHHIVASFSDGMITYYVDGVQVGNAVSFGGQADIEVFGSWLNYGYAPADELDDIRVWQRALSSVDVDALYNAGRDPVVEEVAGYPVVAVSSTSESPVGDVGFAKGDKPAFYLYSEDPYDVWFKVADSWVQYQSGSYSGGMSFQWPDGSTHCYVEKSVAGQYVHMFERDQITGFFVDSDDEDSVADAFVSQHANCVVVEYDAVVDGENPIVIGWDPSNFIMVFEDGVVSFEYGVEFAADSITLTPPAGKDGAAIKVKSFTFV